MEILIYFKDTLYCK